MAAEPDESVTPGRLYVVACPIGHPQDLGLRAIAVLRDCAAIAAENPAVTARLLKAHGIRTAVLPIGRHSGSIAPLIALLCSGSRLALVCDAGTPGLADPGAAMVKAAVAAGCDIEPVPGASAVSAALSIAGIPAGRFVFEGFPPRSRTDRARFFQSLAGEPRAIVLFETPRFLRSTFEALAVALGPARPVTLVRDISLPTFAVERATLSELAAQKPGRLRRGRYTVVVAPPSR